MNSNKAIVYLILAILIALVAIFFSLQNGQVIELHLFSARFKLTLAVALLGFMALGVLITLFLMLPRVWNASRKTSKIQKSKDQLEDAMEDLKTELSSKSAKYNLLSARALPLLPEAERVQFEEAEKKEEEKGGGFLSGMFGK